MQDATDWLLPTSEHFSKLGWEMITDQLPHKSATSETPAHDSRRNSRSCLPRDVIWSMAILKLSFHLFLGPETGLPLRAAAFRAEMVETDTAVPLARTHAMRRCDGEGTQR